MFFGKKKILPVLLFLAGAALSAKSFSLQIIQRNTAGDEAYEASYLVEQVVMEHFFNLGMIVSNNSVLVASGDDEEDARALNGAFAEAREGGMDFVVKLSLEFGTGGAYNPQSLVLSHIKRADVEIVSMDTLRTLAQDSLAPSESNLLRNNRDGIEAFAVDVALNIQSCIEMRGGAI